MSQLFAGKALKRKSGDNFTDDSAKSLEGKVVALYFSAHWCPPCRMFTPVLKDFYDELAGEKFEVVFVSFDHAEDDQKKYLKEAHGDWLFIPFGDPLIKDLSTKYSVQGIPMLVIVKPDGTAVVANARGDLQGKGKAPAQVLKDWKGLCGV